MRNLLFVLLAALSFHAQAQLWELADQRSEEIYFEKALPVGGGRWAVIGNTGFGGIHMISVRNGDGTIAWEQIDSYYTGQGMGDVVLLPDSGLLHVGANDGCDYFGPDSRVRRYATDGSVLWERTIESQTGYLVTMAAKGSIGHLAVASQDSVYIMDMDGNLVGGYHAALSDIQQILWAGDSALFLVRGTDLHLVDLDGNSLASTPIGSTAVDLNWKGQELFVLTNGTILRFSADLTPLGIVALSDIDWNSRFVVSDSHLFVNTASGLYQIAADGTPTFLFPWPALPDLTTTGCAVRNDGVLSLGNTNISGRSTGVMRMLSIAGDAAQYDQDVEVLLHVDSTWTEFMFSDYWKRRADITSLVVNHGSDTLHNVVVSMWVQVPFVLCDQPTNRIDTSGFALAPGDTLSLPFGAVDVAQGVYSSQVVGAGDICIVALAPDHLADRAPQDNTACASVDFVLGVNEPVRNASLKLAPNPATNTCMVSGLTALGASVRLRIMDPVGRIVTERTSNSSSNSLELDVSGLPSGTNFLSAEGERSKAMMKLVITRP
ncbi:MAG: T9SS type A sorting domain-containing protein [Flavobacteriales bacterium]|nr:T9SS type A sorting domain-containing protein [Flavobacteriales bacterium]